MSRLKLFRLLLFPFAAALLCFACGQNQPAHTSSGTKSEGPIFIQLSESSEYKNTLNLTDIASDVRYIPLETNSDCLIGNMVSTPKFTKDFIFIETGGILLQFDPHGKFIRRINKFGKGPGECDVRDYGVDEKNRLIHIFDNWNLGVYTFTFEGEHIKTLRNPFSGVPDGESPSHMGYDEVKGNLFFSFENSRGNMKYKYVVTDTAGNILYKCPNYTQYHFQQHIFNLSLTMTLPLNQYDSSYYYEDNLNDTIFMVNEDYSCSPAYIRSLHNRVTLKDQLELGARVIHAADMKNKNKYYGVREDEKYLYLYHAHGPYNNNGISLLSLYEKKTGALIENLNPKIANNWDGGMDITLYPNNQNENQFCLFVQAYSIKKALTDDHFADREIAHPDKAEALKKLVRTLREDDNPVLMIITMK